MKKTIIFCALLISACSSEQKLSYHEKVVARIDNLEARPAWLVESRPVQFLEGKVISLGSTTIPGDNRVEAAYRIAENNAKSLIAAQIEQRLEFIFQNAEEGTGVDQTQARFIGAETSNLISSSLKVDNRYWEKIEKNDSNGNSTLEYKVFSTVTIPEKDLKLAVLEASRKRQGKAGLSKDFAERVNSHWDNFVDEKK